MACTHTTDCPLFPKLNASLAAWRTHYCDTDRQWLNCARYERSLRGEAVPVALLPNGKVVGLLTEHGEPVGGAVATALAERADEPPSAIKPSLWRRLFGRGQ